MKNVLAFFLCVVILLNVTHEQLCFLYIFVHFISISISIQVQQKMDDDFVTWIPNNIKSSIVKVPPIDTPMCGTFVANTTAVKDVFTRIAAQFAKLYKRKAFLHWYKGEGMDEMEFQEADKNARDLVTEYQDKQDAIVEDDEDDDADEDDNEEEDDDDDE